MERLTKNAISILGEKGKLWINNLPNIIEILVDHWKLSHLIPVNNMTYHYVAKAKRQNNQLVVLKIGFDQKVTLEERQALTFFDGNASVRLIDYHEQYNALLLQQAIPGDTLKSFYPANVEFVMDCYADTVKRLHQKWVIPLGFRHIRDWLKAIDSFASDQLPEHLLKNAIKLKNNLFSSMEKEILLHGDLHQDNLLKNGNTWLTIDPKGIIGELAFEVAAFDFIHASDLGDNLVIKKLFDYRVNRIAEKINLNSQPIKDWVFVRLILSAVWLVEDKGNPGWAIKLAEILI